MTENEDAETEYVAMGPHAWGRGRHETDAFEKMAANLPSQGGAYAPDGPDFEVVVYRVTGFDSVNGMGHLHAEEIHSKERLSVEAKHAYRVKSLLGDAEIAAEEALVEADEIVENEA